MPLANATPCQGETLATRALPSWQAKKLRLRQLLPTGETWSEQPRQGHYLAVVKTLVGPACRSAQRA
jgi:hypothetical protein